MFPFVLFALSFVLCGYGCILWSIGNSQVRPAFLALTRRMIKPSGYQPIYNFRLRLSLFGKENWA